MLTLAYQARCMKKLLFIALLLLPATLLAQRVTKKETTQLTQEQRLVRESSRKGKKGKKKLSMKKRVKIDQQQDRKARRVRKR